MHSDRAQRVVLTNTSDRYVSPILVNQNEAAAIYFFAFLGAVFLAGDCDEEGSRKCATEM